jgi:hypothetical protein
MKLFFFLGLFISTLSGQIKETPILTNPPFVQGLGCHSTIFHSGLRAGACSKTVSYSLMIHADNVVLFGDVYEDKIVKKMLHFKKGTIVQIQLQMDRSYSAIIAKKQDENEAPILQAPIVAYTNAQVHISFRDVMPPLVYTYQGQTYSIAFPPCTERETIAP